jgi:hypothetical protein
MFGFLKRVIGIADAYSAGKGYEQAYKLAELSSLIYLDKHWKIADAMGIAVWSYLFCTEPTEPGVTEFRERRKDEITETATLLLDSDEPFREVVVSSLWVALAVARSRDDRGDFERIFSSSVFKQYSTSYPMLPHDRYAALVEGWSRKYSPLPSADGRQ